MSVYVIKPSNDDIFHYGIPKMRWGQRRYQNKDGSLTPAGRERYGVGESKAVEEYKTKQKEREQRTQKYLQERYGNSNRKITKEEMDQIKNGIKEYTEKKHQTEKKLAQIDNEYQSKKFKRDENGNLLNSTLDDKTKEQYKSKVRKLNSEWDEYDNKLYELTETEKYINKLSSMNSDGNRPVTRTAEQKIKRSVNIGTIIGGPVGGMIAAKISSDKIKKGEEIVKRKNKR